MAKYYKVNLHKLSYDNYLKTNKFYKKEVIEKIIVKKNLFSETAEELLTGLLINITESENLDKNINDYITGRYQDIKNYGFALAVTKQDFVPKNLATPAEIADYVDDYEKSEFKETYNQLKIFDKDTKKLIKQQISKYKNIKR